MSNSIFITIIIFINHHYSSFSVSWIHTPSTRWTGQLASACSGIVDLMTVTQDTPSAVMTCIIHVVKIDMFIHTSSDDDDDSACFDDDHGVDHHDDHGLPKASSSLSPPLHAMWEDIIKASGLIDTPSVVIQRNKWQLVSTYSDPSTENPFNEILVDQYGGFKASINGRTI